MRQVTHILPHKGHDDGEVHQDDRYRHEQQEHTLRTPGLVARRRGSGGLRGVVVHALLALKVERVA